MSELLSGHKNKKGEDKMSLTQESLLSFLLEREGKVRNSELVNHFRRQIHGGDPAEKQRNRDLFKKLVNSVAVVKQIDGVKFVVAKKRYQDFVKEAARDGAQGTRVDDSPPTGSPVPRPGPDSTPVKVTNIPAVQTIKARTSGAVFAVVAVKFPARDAAPGPQIGSRPRGRPDLWTGEPIASLTDVSTPSVQTRDPDPPACNKGSLSDPRCWKNPMTDTQTPGFPLVRPPNRREEAKYSESVPLEPLAHEWLVKCAAGLWGQMYGLLLQDTRLAQKKDFMSGFTALHWAAKNGNSEMIHRLVDTPRRRGTYVDINSKAHGGYTPLHIAAMHGHGEVAALLVQRYGANVNERDHDGKKASHYLGDAVSAEVRALMGGLQPSEYREKTEYDEHTKGFNTISKLFQPHKKQKTTTKCAHDG
ncbi:ankyrin repeat domain-containing protein SOWAHA [Gasterosteus aculeatus]